ncbi:MAG: methionine gamma-lyase [Chloroflexi bacterium]|nr:MAG: methionine gamma-lyase [Chloroflexota bacterium]
MGERNLDSATRVVHAGERVHVAPSVTWPIAPPIVQTSVYAYPDIAAVDAVHEGEAPGYIYGGYGVPNQSALEAALAELEGAEAAVVTTSGSNAIAVTLLGLTAAGSRVVAAINCYGGTRVVLDQQLARFGVSTTYVHPADIDAVIAALHSEPRPALLWVDTIANPTIRATDIPCLATLASDAGVPLVVDNTFATPYHAQPLTMGADIVLHSTTKFIGGHNDSRGGAILADSERIAQLRRVAIHFGAIGAPFEAWLQLRGLRTLDVRMERSSANALAIAEACDGHPHVRRVHYPGLPSDPGHSVAVRTLRHGFGSMLSIDLGTAERARAVVDRLQLVVFAETLGGLMTTVVHPRSASYRSLTEEELARIGVSPGLLRFSVGIESPEDLVRDILGALNSLA